MNGLTSTSYSIGFISAMGKTHKRDKYFSQGSVENRVNPNFSHQKPPMLKNNMKSCMYFSDPLLIPRINQYLSDNKDKVYIDINDMVNELQMQYREYGRRKKNAFKPLVEKAFSFVLQQCGLAQHHGEEMNNCEEGSGNSSSEVEECNSEGDEGRTSSNNQLINLYHSSQLRNQLLLSKQCSATSNENAELIDLSSDDENSKKKDGSEEKDNSAAKLNNLQSRFGNKETTLTMVKPGTQTQTKVDRPSVTITAKRSRAAVEDKPFVRMSKKKKLVIPVHKSTTFEDFGGDPKVLEEVCKLALHISHPEIYKEMGVTPPRGFLLHGPPGCGKTLLATAIAGELEVELIHVSAPELVGGVSGESEERIRNLFDRAVESTPCILFIDEVDAICPNRENAQREMERRIVAQLLTCLDDLSNKPNGEMVLVIGATNRPDSIDPALRRAGRFDREVCLGIPDVKTREKILKVLCSNLNLSPNFSFEELAQITPGFVGADLLSLAREAATVAINRLLGALQTMRKKEENSKVTKQSEENKENGRLNGKGKPEKEDEAMEVDVETTEKGENNKETEIEKHPEDKVENEEKKEKEEETAADKANEKKSEEKAGSSVDDSPKEALKEVKTGNEDEIDVEVIGDNAPKNEQPTLETLLYWLRDSSPLPHRQLKNICITQDDFKQALKFVQPSSKREGFATVPDVTWDDVGSLADVREELQMSVLGPVKYRKQFEELGLSTPAGILICGPPGCGKTLLAKAVANEAGINFISVKGPELLNMYVGESERAVRRCFQRARNSAPCVIFFDELDALCPKRSDSSENGATTRVVNQLLTEMDGIEDRKEVYLMAATNRPDIIDPAVLRPGRLDKVIYVGLPKPQDRIDILRALTKNGTRPKLGSDVNLESIAVREECNGFSGADLAALIREAGVQAVKELMTQSEVNPNAEATVCERHFEMALKKIQPSVNPESRKYYVSIEKRYATSKT